MNPTVERRVRDVKERKLSMLLYSTLPVASPACSCVQNRMPTRTTEGT